MGQPKKIPPSCWWKPVDLISTNSESAVNDSWIGFSVNMQWQMARRDSLRLGTRSASSARYQSGYQVSIPIIFHSMKQQDTLYWSHLIIKPFRAGYYSFLFYWNCQDSLDVLFFKYSIFLLNYYRNKRSLRVLLPNAPGIKLYIAIVQFLVGKTIGSD